MPSPSLNRQIALIYRIYFLYLDPIFALSGVYLILADPAKFLISTTPQPITVSNGAITPLVSLLLTNIAALYAYLAVSSAVVLRVTEERAVWVAVVGGLVMSDVGHIWGVYEAAPERSEYLDAVELGGVQWVVNMWLMMNSVRIYSVDARGDYQYGDSVSWSGLEAGLLVWNREYEVNLFGRYRS